MTSRRALACDTTSASQLFTRQELVGRGAYGAVYRGIENATGQVVAIKVLNLDTEEEDVSDIQREIATLSQLKNCDSQNITRYHGSFLNGTKLWIVMDYAAGGSIRALLRDLRKIDEKCIALIAREVLQALVYLHRHGIIHRDIKAANILLTEEGRVQLCDFGVAGQVTMTSLKRNSFVGTPYWMAPEVIKEGQTYDYKIATGNPPFADQDPMRAVFLIPRSRPVQLDGDWTPAMKEFVALCLHEEANQRPSAEDLLKTKWIKSTNKTTLAPLKDLVAKYEHVKAEAARNKEDTKSEIDIDHELESFDMENDTDAWRFDTNKTMMASPMKSPVSSPTAQDRKSSLTNGQEHSAEDGEAAVEGKCRQSSTTQDELGSPSVAKIKAAPMSPSSVPAQVLKSAKSTPNMPNGVGAGGGAGRETHPLLRLFMTDKEAENETNGDARPGGLVSSVNHHPHPIPRQLTIPSLEELPHLRMAARSPSFPLDYGHHDHHAGANGGASSLLHHRHPHHPHADSQHPPPLPPRLPFGFPSSKMYNFDRRPSAPVLATSHYQFQHQQGGGGAVRSGEPSLPPLTSPRPMTPQPRSFISNLHHRSDLASSSDTPASLSDTANTTASTAPLSNGKPGQSSLTHEDGLQAGHPAVHMAGPLASSSSPSLPIATTATRPGSTPASPRLPLKHPMSHEAALLEKNHQPLPPLPPLQQQQ
ncbi:hypothetical protein BGZ73_007769, partial [Actinomortierella ambigua]